MKNWRMWAGVLAVFACGLAVGGVGGSLWERHTAMERFEKLRGGGPALADMTMDRLRRELELSQEQVAKITPMVNKSFEMVHQMIQDTRPKLDAVLQQTIEQIKPLLNAEQLRRLERGGQWQMLRPPPPPRHQGEHEGPPPPHSADGRPGGPPPPHLPDGPPGPPPDYR